MSNIEDDVRILFNLKCYLESLLASGQDKIYYNDLLYDEKTIDCINAIEDLLKERKKYAQDKRTGYYTCTSGNRKRLHVAIWEHEHGVCVPPGCVIHHLDWNKSNNTVENLVCLTIWEHECVHNIIGGEKGKALGYELVKNRAHGLPPDVV